ncbi:MAG: hypothetical protein V7L27_14180 [Nostoc sp.]
MANFPVLPIYPHLSSLATAASHEKTDVASLRLALAAEDTF